MPRMPRPEMRNAPAIKQMIELMRDLDKFYRVTKALARFDKVLGVKIKGHAKCRTCGRRVHFSNKTTYRLALHFRVKGHDLEDERLIRGLLAPMGVSIEEELEERSSSSSSPEEAEDNDESNPFPPMSPIVTPDLCQPMSPSNTCSTPVQIPPTSARSAIDNRTTPESLPPNPKSDDIIQELFPPMDLSNDSDLFPPMSPLPSDSDSEKPAISPNRELNSCSSYEHLSDLDGLVGPDGPLVSWRVSAPLSPNPHGQYSSTSAAESSACESL